MGHAPNIVVVLAGLLCSLVQCLEGFPAREEGEGGEQSRAVEGGGKERKGGERGGKGRGEREGEREGGEGGGKERRREREGGGRGRRREREVGGEREEEGKRGRRGRRDNISSYFIVACSTTKADLWPTTHK